MTLIGSSIHSYVNVKFDGVSQEVAIEYQNVAENTVIDIYPTENPLNYDLNSGATWSTDHWTATMPDEDLTISIDYIVPPADPELAWSANSATVTLGADDNIFPTLSNPHDIVSISYESSNTTVADIDSYGLITLVSPGNTTISAVFAGDETYSASTVSYALTVESGGGESGSSGAS